MRALFPRNETNPPVREFSGGCAGIALRGQAIGDLPIGLSFSQRACRTTPFKRRQFNT